MAAVGVIVAHAWNQWGIQSLVLLSFTLQATLLILAEFRRRINSGILRLFVWSAYMLADATAIYVLGHMSVTSRSSEHQLMAFWAPFLLLHLGGQDNITAYAIEDNRLWLRHLQTLGVQVAAAGYVLYGSSIIVIGGPSSSLLGWATVIMFVVGVAKYGERVWTLRCAGPWDTEAYLLMAHRMLDVPMDLFKGPLGQDTIVYPFAPYLRGEDLYKVVEMQLSLMHDVFYTKVEVKHSNVYGLLMNILVAVATATAFVLFQVLVTLGDRHHGKDKQGYPMLDMVVTYVLLVGAVIFETVSLVRTMFSSWTCPLLVRWSRDKNGMEEHTVCNYLGHAITSLRRLVRVADWRRSYWSGSIGQHNLLKFGARSRASRISRIARWMGFEDWWTMLAFSWSIPVPAFVEEMLVNQVLKAEGVSEIDDDGQLFDSRGRAKLKRWGLYDGDNEGGQLTWSLDERVLVWHIATNIYLGWWHKKHTTTNTKQPKAEAVEALSNYMMFLLAADPYMLSPTTSRSSSYMEVCYGLTTRGPQYTSAEELASVLRSYGDELLAAETGSTYTSHRAYGFRLDFTTQIHLKLILQTGCKLGAKLISEEVELQDDRVPGSLEVLAQVWVEALSYAAQQCSADSHAKQLSNGGELVTVAALLVKYLTKQNFPEAGTRFDPRRWHRGGPFGSPLPNDEDDTIFSLARAEALHLSPNHSQAH
ncbi:hypothetical protein GUJ93_ZPchr0003g17898 [Zizania palustris]|uniref:DUF4220 domain-containing protein n=1 Tax=Zizania palustris TaxID=103762 RepID=A0A8J5SAF5_ZIZPA|nr:hypothetical protein GUJ93_ZPchr0003g17898 [Zizania palustris]